MADTGTGSVKSRAALEAVFKNRAKPDEEDYADVFKSVWHKEDLIPAYNLQGGTVMLDAVPATNPGTPTPAVLFYAQTPGTYSFFLDTNGDPIVLAAGEMAYLRYNGSCYDKISNVQPPLPSITSSATGFQI